MPCGARAASYAVDGCAPSASAARRRGGCPARTSRSARLRHSVFHSVVERADRGAVDAQDAVARLQPGDVGRAVVVDTRSTRTLAAAARRSSGPSRRAGSPRARRAARNSARIGLSRSTGTNMLPGRRRRSLPSASFTTSEPMPTSSPSQVEQARAAVVAARRRGEQRAVDVVFPVAGERRAATTSRADAHARRRRRRWRSSAARRPTAPAELPSGDRRRRAAAPAPAPGRSRWPRRRPPRAPARVAVVVGDQIDLFGFEDQVADGQHQAVVADRRRPSPGARGRAWRSSGRPRPPAPAGRPPRRWRALERRDCARRTRCARPAHARRAASDRRAGRPAHGGGTSSDHGCTSDGQLGAASA